MALLLRTAAKTLRYNIEIIMKTKYWTATYSAGVSGSKPFLTTIGLPFTNLHEAKKAKHRLNSSNAVVVRADKDEKPTTEVVV